MDSDKLCIFSLEVKTPGEKETLNISDSWKEMSFLSNFNISYEYC